MVKDRNAYSAHSENTEACTGTNPGTILKLWLCALSCFVPIGLWGGEQLPHSVGKRAAFRNGRHRILPKVANRQYNGQGAVMGCAPSGQMVKAALDCSLPNDYQRSCGWR